MKQTQSLLLCSLRIPSQHQNKHNYVYSSKNEINPLLEGNYYVSSGLSCFLLHFMASFIIFFSWNAGLLTC